MVYLYLDVRSVFFLVDRWTTLLVRFIGRRKPAGLIELASRVAVGLVAYDGLAVLEVQGHMATRRNGVGGWRPCSRQLQNAILCNIAVRAIWKPCR